jgi:hypothetical protein
MINKDDYKQRILVLCNQGYQSSFAAANLVRIGLSNATDIKGGVQGWLLDGLPIVPFETSRIRALLVASRAQSRSFVACSKLQGSCRYM